MFRNIEGKEQEIRSKETPKWRRNSIIENENNMKKIAVPMKNNNVMDNATRKFFEEKHQHLIEKIQEMKIEDLQFVEFKLEPLKFEEFKMKDVNIEQFKMEELKIFVEILTEEYNNKKNKMITLFSQRLFNLTCPDIDDNPNDYVCNDAELIQTLAKFGVKKKFFENLMNGLNVSALELIKELRVLQHENDQLRKQNRKLTGNINNMSKKWQSVEEKLMSTESIHVLSNRLNDYQKEIEKFMKIIEELVKIINKNDSTAEKLQLENLQSVKKLYATEISMNNLQNEINRRNETIHQNNTKIQELQETLRIFKLGQEGKERKEKEEKEQKERKGNEKKEREEKLRNRPFVAQEPYDTPNPQYRPPPQLLGLNAKPSPSPFGNAQKFTFGNPVQQQKFAPQFSFGIPPEKKK